MPRNAKESHVTSIHAKKRFSTSHEWNSLRLMCVGNDVTPVDRTLTHTSTNIRPNSPIPIYPLNFTLITPSHTPHHIIPNTLLHILDVDSCRLLASTCRVL